MNTLNYIIVASILVLAGAFISPAQLDGEDTQYEKPVIATDMDMS